jgi:hypothetical protein
MVFQGMHALKTYGDKDCDISEVSRNAAKTVTRVTGDDAT